MTTSHTYPRSCSPTYPGAAGICYGVPLWLCAGAFLTAGLVVGGRSAMPAADDDPSASLVSSRYLLVIQHASNRRTALTAMRLAWQVRHAGVGNGQIGACMNTHRAISIHSARCVPEHRQ